MHYMETHLSGVNNQSTLGCVLLQNMCVAQHSHN